MPRSIYAIAGLFIGAGVDLAINLLASAIQQQAFGGQFGRGDAGLLAGKAIALLCLGQKDKALAALKEALAQRLPGDVIEFTRYELLRAAPQPPEGIEEMIALLRSAST